MPENVAKKGVLKAFTNTDFWVDAALVVGGVMASQAISEAVAKSGRANEHVAAWSGPVATVAIGGAIRNKYGAYFAMGGAVAAVQTLLGYFME